MRPSIRSFQVFWIAVSVFVSAHDASGQPYRTYVYNGPALEVQSGARFRSTDTIQASITIDCALAGASGDGLNLPVADYTAALTSFSFTATGTMPLRINAADKDAMMTLTFGTDGEGNIVGPYLFDLSSGREDAGIMLSDLGGAVFAAPGAPGGSGEAVCGPGRWLTMLPSPAANADYAEQKRALTAAAIVRYEYGASLTPRPRLLATLVAMRRIAARNPSMTPTQLSAFAAAYDARLRAASPGDSDLTASIGLMTAVRFPAADLAPVPAGILNGIDTEIDAEVLQDLDLDPYVRVTTALGGQGSGGVQQRQLQEFQFTQVGFLVNSGVVAQALRDLFLSRDADGFVHPALAPAAAAYLATQPAWDSTGASPIAINPFPTEAVLAARYPSIRAALDRLPPTAEAFSAAAADGFEEEASDVIAEMRLVRAFVDDKATLVRALLSNGATSLHDNRISSLNTALVERAVRQRQSDLRELADRRAAVDVRVLVMTTAALQDESRPYMLQRFSAVQLDAAASSWSTAVTAIQGVSQLALGGAGATLRKGLNTAEGLSILIGAGGTLASLFSSGPSPEEQILEELAAIRNQLSEFQLDMQERLNHIDRAIAASYAGLSTQLSSLEHALNTLGNDVQQLRAAMASVRLELSQQKSALARFEENVYGMLENGFNYDFRVTSDIALGFRDRNSGIDMYYAAPTPAYDSFEGVLHTYATQDAASAPGGTCTAGLGSCGFGGTDTLDLSAGTIGAGGQLVFTPTNPIGRQINSLRTAPMQLGLPPLAATRLANPTTWAINTDAFAQLQRENPWYAAAHSVTAAGRWNAVRTVGRAAQQAMWDAKSQPLFDALFERYAADVSLLQADLESQAALNEWEAEACMNCGTDLWPGNPARQASFLRWAASKMTGPNAHFLKQRAEQATVNIRLMDAYLSIACPNTLERSELLRGMLRGNELSMDREAYAGHLSLVAGMLEVPGAVGLMAPPSLTSGFARFTHTPTFAPAPSVFSLAVRQHAPTVWISPSHVAIGDLNGDGVPDLVTAMESSQRVEVRLGLGNGRFGEEVGVFTVGNSPRGTVIGDFNGDTTPDLAVLNNGWNSVSILRGTGSGDLQSMFVTGGSTFGTDGSPLAIAMADVNGDGRPDLVVANGNYNETEPFPHSVTVLIGQGNGAFDGTRWETSFPGSAPPNSVALADMNLDGWPDIITASPGQVNSLVSVLLGNGNGTFQPPINHVFGSEISVVSVAVINADTDGFPDVVVANFGTSTALVLRGNGDGTLQVPLSFTTPQRPTSIAAGDLDGDGRPDIVTAHGQSSHFHVLRGIGDGTFQPFGTFTTGAGCRFATVADLDRDGRPDVIAANATANTVTVFRNTSPFDHAAVVPSGTAPYALISSDVNGDGAPDVISVDSQGDRLLIHLRLPQGGFASPAVYAVGAGPSAVAVGDVNGDGRVDLVISNYTGNTVSLLFGLENGTFGPAQHLTGGVTPHAVALADVNSDGLTDIITANHFSNSVMVRLGAGNGSFLAPVGFGVGSQPLSVAVSDFNRDGRPDLVSANIAANSVSLRLGNGNGTFQPAVNFGVGANPYSLSVGDFNGDEYPDVVTANHGGNTVTVLLANPTGGGPAITHYPAAPARATWPSVT